MLERQDADWGRDYPEVNLPSEADLQALDALRELMPQTSPGKRTEEATRRGLLRDLANAFDPKGEGIEKKRISDLKTVLVAFRATATALGHVLEPQPECTTPILKLQLSQCRIEGCGNLSRTMPRIPFGLCFHECLWPNSIYFTDVTFGSMADFHYSEFHAEAKFYLVKFEGDADFRGVRFCKDAEFCGSEFRESASFFMAAFHGCANFSGTRFDGSNEFLQTTFSGPVDFRDADFAQPLDLRKIEHTDQLTWNFHNVKFNGSTILAGHLHINRESLHRWKWFLPGWIGLIHGDSKWPVSFIALGQTIWQIWRGRERVGDFMNHYRRHYRHAREDMLAACEQYGVLEANVSVQPYADSWDTRDWCHFRYLDLHRRTRRRLFCPQRWANWLFLKWCFGYGAYPRHVLVAGLVTIVLFALVYTFWLPQHLWTSCDPTMPNHNLAVENTWYYRFGNAMYFSVITFATVGYGDWHPVHYAKPVAAIEGLLGILIMSVFTVSFARKILR